MDDKAHVRLVDAHAKGDGGADHADLVAQEFLLVPGTLVGGESGVIGLGQDAVLGQFAGELLGRFAGLAIDDAALALPGLDVVEHLAVRAGLGGDAIGQIRAVEAGDVARRILQMQLLDDVGPDALGGGGGQRHQRHAGKLVAKRRDLPVFRPEIMAPFADAMGLVDGEQVHVPFLQILEKAGQHQPLGGDIEQLELALVEPAQAGPGKAGGEGRIQKGGGHAGGLQGIHLILHQGDQRRHHHGEPGPDEGGELKTERFAAARRQHGDDVAAAQGVADDGLLQGAEGAEPEHLLQCREQWGVAG